MQTSTKNTPENQNFSNSTAPDYEQGYFATPEQIENLLRKNGFHSVLSDYTAFALYGHKAYAHACLKRIKQSLNREVAK
jgi:hypothetical protein